MIYSFVLCASLVASVVNGADDIDFDALVKIAKKYELPMPPREAKPVLATRGWSTLVEGSNSSSSHDPGIYELAFLLQAPDKDAKHGEAVALIG